MSVPACSECRFAVPVSHGKPFEFAHCSHSSAMREALTLNAKATAADGPFCSSARDAYNGKYKGMCGPEGKHFQRGPVVIHPEQAADDLKYLTAPTDDWALRILRNGVGRLASIEADAQQKIAEAMQG